MANSKHDFIKVIHAFIILDIFAVYILRFKKLKLCEYLGQQSSIRNTVQHTQTPLALSLLMTEQILASLLRIDIL